MSSSGRYRRNRLKALGAFQDDRCFFCGEPLLYLEPKRSYSGGADSNMPLVASFDHYIPRKEGGAGTRENTVIAHRDCNSKKGHEPTPELDEKLRLLNQRRGYGDENGIVPDEQRYRRLRPQEFGPSFPALLYLCDLANEIDGLEGRRVRDKIARRIQNHKLLLKELSAIQSTSLRWEAINTILAHREQHGHQQPLPEPLEEVLNNVCKTITRSVWNAPLSKGQKRRRVKMLRQLPDEQRQRLQQRIDEREEVARSLELEDLEPPTDDEAV